MDIRKFFPIITDEVAESADLADSGDSKDSANSKDPVNTLKTNNKVYEVFTDGSSINNGYKNCIGGIGVFFEDDSLDNVSRKVTKQKYGKVSNNICEMDACIVAINIIINKPGFQKNSDTIIIYTDSQYLINCITKWCWAWEKNNWKRKTRSGQLQPVKNVNLIKEIKKLTDLYSIRFKHCKAHQKEPDKSSKFYKEWYGNMMAGKLANTGAKS